jgi:hypothetical protein
MLSTLARTRRNIAALCAVGIVYLLPLGHQVFVAHAFLVGSNKRLNIIGEMQSIRQMAEAPDGIGYVSGFYSLFLWLWPITMGVCAFRAWVERTSGRLFFWVCALCGLSLLIMQYRLHYFGTFALILPWLILLEALVSRWQPRRKLVMLAASLVFVLMFSMALRIGLTAPAAMAGGETFPALRLILDDLRKACAKEPGVVLADNDAGHYIRYYTECSVISNNFLLTRQHEEKVELSDHLLSLSPDEMPDAAPYVRYVLLRPVAVIPTPDGPMYTAYSQVKEVKLFQGLLLKPLDQVSPRYAVIRDVNRRFDADKDPVPLMRLFKVLRRGEPHPPPEPILLGRGS